MRFYLISLSYSLSESKMEWIHAMWHVGDGDSVGGFWRGLYATRWAQECNQSALLVFTSALTYVNRA